MRKRNDKRNICIQNIHTMGSITILDNLTLIHYATKIVLDYIEILTSKHHSKIY